MGNVCLTCEARARSVVVKGLVVRTWHERSADAGRVDDAKSSRDVVAGEIN